MKKTAVAVIAVALFLVVGAQAFAYPSVYQRGLTILEPGVLPGLAMFVGKDAEAAMALSLGKPVIFYCDEEQKSRFYRDVHPLSRLVDFGTGVAVGAIVTDNLDEVPELLSRLFRNEMEYLLERTNDGYLRLREALTSSVIRLQSNDQLLTETFWNHYQS